MRMMKTLFVGIMLVVLMPASGMSAKPPDSPQVLHMELLQKAKGFYDKGISAQAIAVCDEYIKELGPDFHPQVWFLRGNAYHKIFKNSQNQAYIGQAIESYEKALSLYKDVNTYTGLDSIRYQIDGLFNLGLLCEEEYKLLSPAWDKQTQKEKELRIISSISQAVSMAEMYGEWKTATDDQLERYLDRSLETYLNMTLLSNHPDVYRPLAEGILLRGRQSKQKEKYAKYEEELAFDTSIKTCVHWIRGKELAESVNSYDEALEHLSQALELVHTDLARAAVCRQVADIYLKKDSFEDKKLALEYASMAWDTWKKNQSEWEADPEIFETYGASLKAVSVGYAMMPEPDYDRIIQLSNKALHIPQWKDKYYMNYLAAYSSYKKGDEERFYRFGKQAVQVILDKHKNDLDTLQSEEEKEVLLFWVNSLRGSGRILEAMRYKTIGETVSKDTM